VGNPWPLLVALLLAACGPAGGTAGPDGGSVGDAGPTLLMCPNPVGPTYIVSSYGLLPPDQGFDLVGDGKVHNELGNLASFTNSYWIQSVANGSSIFLLDFPGLPNPIVDETNFPFYFFTGTDADDPPDPSNNTSGTGQFLVPLKQYDVNCQPTTIFSNSVIAGGKLSANSTHLDIVAQAIGDFVSSDDVVTGTFASDASTLTGLIGGIGSACSMNKVSSPIGSGNFTMLDSVVTLFNMQPDIDRDHDGGLDHFISDGQQVTTCIASDGTMIQGHFCACDPRIRDGYSLAFYFNAVPAQIVGFAIGR
jgi:hypothetical protein